MSATAFAGAPVEMVANASQPKHPPARSVPIVPVIRFTAARSVTRMSSKTGSPPSGAAS
jgi:hypothetical protein